MRSLMMSAIAVALALTAVSGVAAAGRDADSKREGTVSDKVDRAKKKITGDATDREQDPVKAAQKALKAKGYEIGDVDGKLGPKTRAAVQAFQKDEGIRVTGRLDKETMARLRAGKADDRPTASTEERDRSASASPTTNREPQAGPGSTSKAPQGEMAKDVKAEKDQDKRK